MDNLWGIKIGNEKFKSPKFIFEEQSKFLAQMTNNIIYLDVSTYKINVLAIKLDFLQDNKPSSTVNYQVNVRSKTLEDYGFNILTYKHDISLYPVEISLNPDIYLEIFNSQSNYRKD